MSRKGYRDGTHRVIAPSATLARVRGLMPALGITRIANVTGLDTIGIPVTMVVRPNARSLSVAQGKGSTLDAARASGLMEAVESWHAETVLAPLVLASYHELRYTRRMATLGGLPRIAGTAFDPGREILWTEADDLCGGRAWLPFEVVHTRYTLPLPPASGTFAMSSSGLGSGNDLDEAIVHGLCELIERDAATLWRLRPPAARAACRLDVATIDDPGARALLDRYQAAGVDVVLWDITTELGVAAIRCEIGERALDPGRPLLPAGGFGCHPSRSVALSRALTEAAQSRLTRIAGSRDDLEPRVDEAMWRSAMAGFRAVADMEGPRRSFGDVVDHDHDDVAEDRAWIVERLRAGGLGEVLVVDLTRPELGIAVVRTVVPGLEGLCDLPGWAAGARALRAHKEAAV